MSDNKQIHRSRLAHLNAARDKENALRFHKSNFNSNKDLKIDVSKKETVESFGFGRPILRSKSTNGLKVNNNHNHSNNQNINSIPKHSIPLNTKPLFPESENANKSRKINKQPISIFGSIDSNENEKENVAYHDTTTLQRSHSHMEINNNNENNGTFNKRNTLSRSSSAFGSSFGSSFNNSLKPRIKSKLTLGADNDMAAFFKSSKFNDQKQFGINNKTTNDFDTAIDGKDKNNDSFNDSSIDISRLEEVTFTDDNDDITMMKKLSTDRNSPVYQRTHKVSIHTLLSSSTDNDDIGETTFDYKDTEKSKPYKLVDLESLIMSKHHEVLEPEPEVEIGKIQDDEFEIEHIPHNKNGIYDDSIPDAVLDGEYQSMNNVLGNLWSKDNSASSISSTFKDPLDLKFKEEDKKEDILNSIQSSNFEPVLDFDNALKLEFSDIEEEEEDGEEDGNDKDKDIHQILKFYQDKSTI